MTNTIFSSSATAFIFPYNKTAQDTVLSALSWPRCSNNECVNTTRSGTKLWWNHKNWLFSC